MNPHDLFDEILIGVLLGAAILLAAVLANS
jgi:hypothetical protein